VSFFRSFIVKMYWWAMAREVYRKAGGAQS